MSMLSTLYSEPLLQVRLGFPPGTNDVYGYTTREGKDGKARAQSYMRGSGTTYKQRVALAIKEANPDFAIPPKRPIYLRLAFFCTPKTFNRRDLDGSTKVLIDVIFKQGGGNDVYIRELVLTKQPNTEDAVAVIMREILDEPGAGDESRIQPTNRRRNNRKVLSGCVSGEEGQEGQGQGDISDAQ